jgi:outer membrane protein TolC
MKIIHLFISFILFAGLPDTLRAQITLDKCREEARKNYPLVKKYGLIEQSKMYSLHNAQKGYLPQIQANVRATYQSDVTAIPISLPANMEIPTLAKEQFQAVVEANQLIWDGGIIRSQQEITKAGSEVENRQLEVELYTLNERVNHLFFGILMIDAQLEQNHILHDELERNRLMIGSYIENGIANQADIDAVKVEQLNALQIRTQLKSMRTAYLKMLSIMTGLTIDEQTHLVRPRVDADFMPSGVNRPEIHLFDAQNHFFDSKKAMIKSTYMPRLGLFVQGGVGRPGLNMLENAVKPFYLGGVRLSWNFGALYTQKNDLRKITTDKNMVDVHREVFLHNIELALAQENQDIKRLRELMKNDAEIISLRENIRKAAEAKVANGTLTVTELMREIAQEDLARQNQAIHEIDLLIAIYKLKNTTNNFNNE